MTAAVEVLVLGAGWSAGFLIPLLKASKVSFEATTRDGRDVADHTTLKWSVDENHPEAAEWSALPKAKTIVLTFPTIVPGAVTKYITGYEKAKGEGARWIQLGSTSAWNSAADADLVESSVPGRPAVTGTPITHKTPIPRPAVARVESEFELLEASSKTHPTCVLNLSGLWGGSRDPKNWVTRIGASKEALATKGGLHMIHGEDVARVVLAVHKDFTPGERWLITDLRVYDWWDLVSAWGTGRSEDGELLGEQPKWVRELMREQSFVVLPRNADEMPGKRLSSLEFWEHFRIMPSKARL